MKSDLVNGSKNSVGAEKIAEGGEAGYVRRFIGRARTGMLTPRSDNNEAFHFGARRAHQGFGHLREVHNLKGQARRVELNLTVDEALVAASDLVKRGEQAEGWKQKLALLRVAAIERRATEPAQSFPLRAQTHQDKKDTSAPREPAPNSISRIVPGTHHPPEKLCAVKGSVVVDEKACSTPPGKY